MDASAMDQERHEMEGGFWFFYLAKVGFDFLKILSRSNVTDSMDASAMETRSDTKWREGEL